MHKVTVDGVDYFPKSDYSTKIGVAVEDTTITHSSGQGRDTGRKAWIVGRPTTNGTVSVLK